MRPVVIPILILACLPLGFAQSSANASVSLPTGKVLLRPAENSSRIDGLPVTIAVSPDGRFAALLHAGFGTQQSRGCQSISIYEFATAKVSDFPDDRLCEDARQTYFMGLVFSSDGSHLYASLGSITDPNGSKPGSTGNAVAVYSFQGGQLKPERVIKIPLQPLADGKRVPKGLYKTSQGGAIPYPAGMTVIPGGKSDRLLVANNLSDNVIVLDPQTGEILQQFDLSVNSLVPSTYPYTVVASKDGRRAWCSLWNASRIAELDLQTGKVVRSTSLREPESPTAPGSHPTALLLSPDEQRLYVALANADAVAAVSTSTGKVERWYSTTLKEQKFGGTSPLALAQSPDSKRLFVADANLNAVAVFDLSASPADTGKDQPALGFIPTDWYPSALTVRGGELLIATAKGVGTGPNTGLSRIPSARRHRENPYIPTLLYGSLTKVRYKDAEEKLGESTRQVEESNLLKTEAATIHFSGGPGIKHVIYIIRENRTYDQVFGDLDIGNGDRSLTLYGEDVTPNAHKLARQFGVLDNFYDSGEVSGDGHVWSDAAITTDYNEKTWPLAYRGKERTYDFDGTLADEIAVDRGIPDVDAPATGFLWANAARHGLTYRNYGEFVSAEFCVEGMSDHPAAEENTASVSGGPCDPKVIRKGEPLPSPTVGAQQPIPSPYPWNIPRLKSATPAMAELREHSDLKYASFNVEYPDQLRVDEFLAEFDTFLKGRGQGKDKELPQLITMHLPNDHTGGTRPGRPTPSANVADNDLAVARIVEAVSHSPYWEDTAIFVLEDDAQDGADHVDAHRSLALVISKYAPGSAAHPFVEHDFHTTVSVMHTIETLLGLPPMNLNDAYSPVMAKEFSGAGDQLPFTADTRNRDNGMLYRMNAMKAPGAKKSEQMDFSRPDAANAHVLNAILWHDRKGSARMPKPRHTVIPASARDDD